MNQPDIAAMLVKHGRPGFRVLEEGEVQARLRGLKQALST
ncbi:MOSC domain-containing protein YiiM [Bradyrhizobium sp. USDA 4011]